MQQMERFITYPGRPLRVFGQPDRKPGNRRTTGVKESAAGILPLDNRREGPNLLTKVSIENA